MGEPWTFKESLAFRRLERPDVRLVEGALFNADGNLVCEIGPIEESVLRRLLAAVNAHEELLAACEEALSLIDEFEPEALDGRDEVPGLLRAAIARAKGETPAA